MQKKELTHTKQCNPIKIKVMLIKNTGQKGKCTLVKMKQLTLKTNK